MLSEYGLHRLDICTIVERLKEDPEIWLKVSHPIHSFVSS
jgi:hypothetical protein